MAGDQHPSMEMLIDSTEDCRERKEPVMINSYNSVNDQLDSAQEEILNNNKPVSKETLEISNGMDLVHDQPVDVCESPPNYVPSTGSRSMEFVKSHDPGEEKLDGQERGEATEAQVFILSDDTKKFPFKSNQNFHQKTDSVDPLIDGSSLNAEMLSETMHKPCSPCGIPDATEVCSLTQIRTSEETQDSNSTIVPNISNMYEQCNKHIYCAYSPKSSSTGNHKSVLGQVVEKSLPRTTSQHAQSCKNGMESEGKKCTDNVATLNENVPVPSPHLKVDTDPNPASTSHSEHSLVCDLQKASLDLPLLEHSSMSVDISNNCIESEESKLPFEKNGVQTIAAQSPCKVVGKVENGGAHMLDEPFLSSQNHCSCEVASSDTNNSNIDSEPDTGQIITPNIMSLSDSANPETSVNTFLSKCKEITSEVNIGTPQKVTDFIETETVQAEPNKNLSTILKPECKIGPGLKASCANRISAPVQMKKKFGLSLKKKKLLKMAKAFSITKDSLETARGLQENHYGNFSREIHVKAKKQQSPPLLENSRKSHKENHTFNTSTGLQPNNFQKAPNESCCFGNLLETEDNKEKQENESRSSKNNFRANPSNTLSIMPTESQNNNADLTISRKQRWGKKESQSTEINSGEVSLQSTGNSTGFCSAITKALGKKVKKKKLLMDVSLKASDEHLGKLSENNFADEIPVCKKKEILLRLSPIRKIERFIRYCDEDYVTALNDNAGQDAVKRTKMGRNFITCKYCSRSFRHISAYTVHQRIHTGEKPYRCKICGKNFAQLSKLKSHRNVHVQSELFPCPCCGRKFSGKMDLMAHFMMHVKESKWNNEQRQQGNKPDAPVTSPTRSERIICNVYNHEIPTGYLSKFDNDTCDKLISCKTCRRGFLTSSQLVDHEKTRWPVKPYACSVCAKGFYRLKALKKHSEKHAGDSPFSCFHCHLVFGDLPTLRLHQLSRLCDPKLRLHGERRDPGGFLVSHGVDGQVNTPMFFKCQLCKRLYRKWCQYTLHLQTHTETPAYICIACGQSYEKELAGNVHCRVCCQTSGEEVVCGASLSEILQSNTRKGTSLKDGSPVDLVAPNGNSPSARWFHKNSQTPTSNLQPIPESSGVIRVASLLENVSHKGHQPSSSVISLNEIEISPRHWRFKCPRCGQRFKRYRVLCLHMQAHAPTFKYVCGPCGHSFERWNKLWLHQRIHRRKGQGYTCSQCNVQFHFFSSYRTHLLGHAEVRPYACPLCRQTFAREEDLHVHQCSLHRPSRKLVCDVCSRSFSTLTKFLKHGLLHKGAISHQCLTCNLSFPNNKSLCKHLNTHSSSASLLPAIPSDPFTFLYSCNRCKSSFSTLDLLFAHQICHTRRFQNRVQSTKSRKSTSGARSSTNPSLLSTLDLDAIPKESLFKYPHPDKLYVPPHLSRSKINPIINLVSGNEQEGCSGPSEQETPKTSREHSVMNSENQAQVLETQSVNQCENLQDKSSHSKLIQLTEISVILEGPDTTVNAADSEKQGESFECADCSEKLGSLEELFKHYLLHAIGNTHL